MQQQLHNGEKHPQDSLFASQGFIDELGQQIIEERMVASRLQASLKAEQNALKLAHRANRQASSQVSRLSAEKQCLETEIVKLKTQLQMERRAWDADELQLADVVQRLTKEMGDLRDALQRSERDRRKLTETLNDERHIKECALNYITESKYEAK
jgi:predicted  nucleic acid-binding Zn-ribbon protein